MVLASRWCGNATPTERRAAIASASSKKSTASERVRDGFGTDRLSGARGAAKLNASPRPVACRSPRPQRPKMRTWLWTCASASSSVCRVAGGRITSANVRWGMIASTAGRERNRRRARRLEEKASCAGGSDTVMRLAAESMRTSVLVDRSIPAATRAVTTSSARFVDRYCVCSYVTTSRSVISTETSLATWRSCSTTLCCETIGGAGFPKGEMPEMRRARARPIAVADTNATRTSPHDSRRRCALDKTGLGTSSVARSQGAMSGTGSSLRNRIDARRMTSSKQNPSVASSMPRPWQRAHGARTRMGTVVTLPVGRAWSTAATARE